MQQLPYHRHDPRERDEAVERVSRTTRWVVAGALLGTGVIVGVAAHELPGKSASTPSTTSSVSSGSSGSGSSAGTSGSDDSGSSGYTGSGGSGGSVVAPPSSPTPRVHAYSGGS